MATARKIVLDPKVRGNYHIGDNIEATERVSQLLQRNLENYHMLFLGPRHNHIVHHLLTILALGASADEVQGAFDRNAWYQKPKPLVQADAVQAMYNKEEFPKFLDDDVYYSSYLEFFQQEIETKGVKAVLEEHLFADDDHANRMLNRTFASLIHPLLHLGYACEFEQPAIVAEALAQAAIHETDFGMLDEFLPRVEKAAGGIGKQGNKTLRQIMDELRADQRIREAHLGEEQVEKFRTVLPKEMDLFVKYISQCTVSPDQVKQTMLDMYDLSTILVTVLPDPPESYKVNFVYLHIINLMVMFPSLMNSAWLSEHNKLRLIEWQARYLLLVYSAHGAQELDPKDLENYALKQGSWEEAIGYSVNHPTDDGHLSKMVRSLAYGQQQLKPLQTTGNVIMKDHLWLKLATLGCISVRKDAKESEDRWAYFGCS